MVYYFAQYAPGDPAAREAAVIAASLVAQAIAFSFQGLLGVVCLKSRVGRALQASTKQAPPEVSPSGQGSPVQAP
jgi:hypothetical protein